VVVAVNKLSQIHERMHDSSFSNAHKKELKSLEVVWLS
jgi:hypothetical protein